MDVTLQDKGGLGAAALLGLCVGDKLGLDVGYESMRMKSECLCVCER